MTTNNTNTINDAELFNLKWEQADFLETLNAHDEAYEIKSEDENGAKITAVGIYSYGDLVEIEDVEYHQTK